jgi:hypothetical protein
VKKAFTVILPSPRTLAVYIHPQAIVLGDLWHDFGG